MKRKKIFGSGFCLIVFLLITTMAWAVPRVINYQGKLANLDGMPVADATYTIHFRIYIADSGGTALWEDTQSVAVVDGIYNITIPADPVSNPFPESLLDNPALYLGITVEADSEMSPRQEITSTFYALKAGDADSISGQSLFDLDDTYVNENQASSITSSMIVDSTVGAADLGANSVGASEIAAGAVGTSEIADGSVSVTDLKDGTALAEIQDDDGPGSLLDADLLDGHNSSEFLLTGSDYGRIGVAANLYEGSNTLTNRYVNEGQTNSITSSMIVNNTVTSADVFDNSLTASDLATNSVDSNEIAAGAVGSSELAWSINYTGADSNGGLVSVINTSNGSTGNFPAGLSGGANGSPTGYSVFGVLGAAPGLGSNSALTSLPHTSRIGVAGASSTGYGVAGVSGGTAGVYGSTSSNTGNGVYGVASASGNYTNFGGWFRAYGNYGYGVSGRADGTNAHGVHGYSEGANGIAVYANSKNGDGLYATTGASDEHAGYFYTGVGDGLAGAALYARSYNTSNGGIALWAENAHTTSTDATAVFSNAGTGPLLKGFGGNGGEDEFSFDNDGTMHIYNGNHMETIRLDPSESGTTDGSQITLYNMDGDATIEIDGSYAGDGRITTQELQITGGSDLSEQFDVARYLNPVPGMLVSIDPKQPGKLTVCTRAYDKKVAGIISGAGGIKTGMMMGQRGTEADGALPVALTGRVYCMADAYHGAIEPGNMLTTSDVPGHAMKVTDHTKATGAIIGKAMTSLKEGKGLVLVLVTLQ